MPIYSKDGSTFYELPEEVDTTTGESLADKKAFAKGYKKFIDVKKGDYSATIPVEELSKAEAKGYVTKQVAEAKEGQEATSKQEIPAWAAAASHAANGATLGLGTHIGAATGAAGDALTDILHGDFDNLKNIPENYVTQKHKIQDFQDRAAAEHPIVSQVAEGVGGFGAGLATMGAGSALEAGASAPSLAGQVIKGVNTGILTGGTAGAANSREDTLEGVGFDALGGAFTGGAVGGAVPLVSSGVGAVVKPVLKGTGKVLDSVGDSVQGFANRRAVKATNLPDEFIENNAMSVKANEKLGKELLDKNLVSAKITKEGRAQEMFDASKALKETSGKNLGAALKAAEPFDKNPPTVADLKSSLREIMKESGSDFTLDPGFQRAANMLEKYRGKAASDKTPVSLTDLQKLKLELNNIPGSENNRFVKQFASKISKDIDSRVASVSDYLSKKYNRSSLPDVFAPGEDTGLTEQIKRNAQPLPNILVPGEEATVATGPQNAITKVSPPPQENIITVAHANRNIPTKVSDVPSSSSSSAPVPYTSQQSMMDDPMAYNKARATIDNYGDVKRDYALGLNVNKSAEANLVQARKGSNGGDIDLSKPSMFNVAKKVGMLTVANGPVSVGANNVAKGIHSMATTLDNVVNNPGSFGRWAPQLQKAASGGPSALGATMYLLSQRDPEFRAHMEQMDKEHAITAPKGK